MVKNMFREHYGLVKSIINLKVPKKGDDNVCKYGWQSNLVLNLDSTCEPEP